MPAIGWTPEVKPKMIVKVSVWGEPHLHSISCYQPYYKREFKNLAEARKVAKEAGYSGIKLTFG